jgi:serine phosphatase RsbU (regulator of sigma subunit)/integral membrane sensor domain MASE1
MLTRPRGWSARRARTRRRATTIAGCAILAGAYYGAAKLGLSFAFETRSVTAVWPPTGLALAALVLWGYRFWPGVAVGAFLANSWTGIPLAAAIGLSCGNTLEALAGAFLLHRVAHFRPTLDRVRDVLALVVLAAVASTAISATIGVATLIAAGEVAGGDFASVWRVWWLGDMGGDLLVAPVLLVAATWWPFTRAPGRAPEAIALAAATVGVSVLVFSHDTNLAYLVFPLLIWAALRFWQPGATTASLVVAAIAVAYTSNDAGPFIASTPDDSLLLAQTFVAVCGTTAMLLAAITTQRRLAEDAHGRLARTLQSSLLPSALPDIPGLETAVHFRPALDGLEVGGDFYDVFETPDGSWAIVVGDVCGKGPEAAAVTALARYTLRASATHERSPSRILTLLNEALLRQTAPAAEFCTVAYARIDHDGTSVQLTTSAGGHPLPLLLRTDGTVETIGEPGLLLGIDADIQLHDHTLELHRGDTLVLYTDGLTDAYAPDRPLDADDVAAVLTTCAGRSASEIADRIQHAALEDDTRQPRDDVALVIVRLTPEVPELLVPSTNGNAVRSRATSL